MSATSYILRQGLLNGTICGSDWMRLASCNRSIRSIVQEVRHKSINLDESALDVDHLGQSLATMSTSLAKIESLNIVSVAPSMHIAPARSYEPNFPKWHLHAVPDFTYLKTLRLHNVSAKAAWMFANSLEQWQFLRYFSKSSPNTVVLYPVLEDCVVSIKNTLNYPNLGKADRALKILLANAPLLSCLKWFGVTALSPDNFVQLRQLDILCDTFTAQQVLDNIMTHNVLQKLVLRCSSICGLQTLRVGRLPSALTCLKLYYYYKVSLSSSLPYSLREFWTNSTLTDQSLEYIKIHNLPRSLTKIGLPFCEERILDSLCLDLTTSHIAEWPTLHPVKLSCINTRADQTIRSSILRGLQKSRHINPSLCYFIAPFVCLQETDHFETYLQSIMFDVDCLLALVKSLLDNCRQRNDTIRCIASTCVVIYDNHVMTDNASTGSLQDIHVVKKMECVCLRYKNYLQPNYRDIVCSSTMNNDSWQYLMCLKSCFGLGYKIKSYCSMPPDCIEHESKNCFVAPIPSSILSNLIRCKLTKGINTAVVEIRSKNIDLDYPYMLSVLSPSVKMLHLCLPLSVYTSKLATAIPKTVKVLYVSVVGATENETSTLQFILSLPRTLKRVYLSSEFPKNTKVEFWMRVRRIAANIRCDSTPKTLYYDWAGCSLFGTTPWILVILSLIFIIALVYYMD